MYKKHITTFCCFFIISTLITTAIVIAKDNGNGKPDLCDKFEEKKDKWFDKWENKEEQEKDWGDKWEEKREKKIDKLDDKKEKFCDECDDDNDGDDNDDNNGNDDDDGNGDGSDKYIGKTYSEGTGNIPPVADVSAGEPYIGFKDENIEFNGSFSYDIDGYIVDFIWRFSDGSIKNGEVVFHSFKINGDYEVELSVTDNDGAINSTITYISVVQPNNPPTAPVVIGPSFGITDSLYDFSVVSFDSDNDNLIYYVDWGDGWKSESPSVSNGTEVIFKYDWDSTGDYIISVKSFDGFTFSETTEYEITIGVYKASTVSDIILFIILILILISVYLILNNRRKEKPKKAGN